MKSASSTVSAPSRMRTVERRIYCYAFVARLYFYIPVLVLHMETVLGNVGVAQPSSLSLSLIAMASLGTLLAEYPSGVLADWLGHSRTLLLAGVLQVAGLACFLLPPSLWSLTLAQVTIGVATAFRSGADTALLHAHLEAEGQTARYGAALSRLRFFNTLAIASSGMVGGLLYQYSPNLVFVLSAVSAGVGSLAVFGLGAPLLSGRRSYRQVLAQSLGAMRSSRKVQVLILLGGLGNPFFVFAFWVTQRYMNDAGISPMATGVACAAISYLQAATMPLSAWFAKAPGRLRRGTYLIAGALPLSFLIVALCWEHARMSGAAVLIVVAGSHVLYKNIINVRLQALAPAHVRASILSFESWIGALGYLVVFPTAGVLFADLGLAGAFAVLSLLISLTLWPPLLWGHRLHA